MRINHCMCLGIVIILLSSYMAKGQDSLPVAQYLKVVSGKLTNIERNLESSSDKLARRYKKDQARLKKKVAKVDSALAIKLFTGAEHCSVWDPTLLSGEKRVYIPYLDTLKTSIRFLEERFQLAGVDGLPQLKQTLEHVEDLEAELKKAEGIRNLLRKRKNLLKEHLDKLGLAKELKRAEKHLYYYSQQFKEYQSILSDRKKIEREAIDLLSRTKLFKDFMKKHSMLAYLFRMPGENASDAAYLTSLAGLQTRAQVNAWIQEQITSGGPNGRAQLTQNIQAAQAQLQRLKNRINGFGKASSEDILPESFNPNHQKTKSFWQRIELGTNIQTQKANQFFPVTSDLGISVGYKLNERFIAGIGGSFKLGWGRGWRHIDITHQGMSFRSFIDWKIKGRFYLSGGYERNYKQQIHRISDLRGHAGWQQSGMIGLSKEISNKGKLFKKTKVQLLWDFMSYSQAPPSPALNFRISYNLK